MENTVGKGEIARYEQFLLFPQCFLKACIPGASKGVIVWEWVNSTKALTHSQTTNFLLFQTQTLQMTISNFMKMAKSSPNG